MNISPVLLYLLLTAGLCGGPVVLPADFLPAPGNLRPASRISAAGCLVSDPARGGCGAAPGPLRTLSFFFSQICARCKLVSASLRAFLHFLNISQAFPGSFPLCRQNPAAGLFPAVFPDLIPDAGRFRALAPVRLSIILIFHALRCGMLSGRTRAHSFPLPQAKNIFLPAVKGL